MKTSVSTYSFGGYMNTLGIEGIIRKSAELGFTGIEFVEGGWTKGLDCGYAKELRALCEENGLTPVAYCTGADFLSGSGGDLRAEVKRLHGQLDFAAALGVPNMRHDVCYGLSDRNGKKIGISFEDVLPILAEGCRETAAYAESIGLGTMTENHGFFVQDANRVEKLINTTAHPAFGALVDVGNFMCADEIPCNSVSIMARYAKHVHAKDFHYLSGKEECPTRGWFQTRGSNYLRGAIIGHGAVGVRQCIRILRNAGYDGWVSVEFEGMEDNILGISLGKEALERYFAG